MPRPLAFDVRGNHPTGTNTVRMLYQNYQLLANAGDPLRLFADHAQSIFRHWADTRNISPLRRMAAYYEQIALMGFTHARPGFGITPVQYSLITALAGGDWLRHARNLLITG